MRLTIPFYAVVVGVSPVLAAPLDQLKDFGPLHPGDADVVFNTTRGATVGLTHYAESLTETNISTTSNARHRRWWIATTKLDFPVNEADMEDAMVCLEEKFCSQPRWGLQGYHAASCTINDMMAYVCNWARFSRNTCELNEMRRIWGEMKADEDNPTQHGLGWWYEPDWQKQYGWDINGAKVCQDMWVWNHIGPIWQFREICDGGTCRRHIG
ncbi:hypothetical protein GQ53DRAFT_836125 [Thozetella sp. PMI_491]|nr:hypothetical protein GQ53DRAFT_836125 [Thozetella sp. PMI_491]